MPRGFDATSLPSLILTSTGGTEDRPTVDGSRETCSHVVVDTRAANPDREVRLTVGGVTHGLWDSDRLTQVCTNLPGNALEQGQPAPAGARRP